MKTKNTLKIAHKKSKRGIHLVASENTMPIEATVPYISNIFNRYVYDVEKDNEKNELKKDDLAYQLPGFTNIEELNVLEQDCNNKLCEMIGGKYSNVKAISGLNTIVSVVGSLVLKNEVILSLPVNAGGHAATKYLVERLGIVHDFLPVCLRENIIDIECDELVAFIKKRRIKLIYIDLMNVIYPINIKKLREIVGNSVIICYDASHVLGMILGGVFQNPLKEGGDILVGSTHKSFPGPHKGIFITNRKWYKMLYEINCNLFISHTHIADIAALSIVLDKGKTYFNTYAHLVQDNIQVFTAVLSEEGITSYSGDSHQIWIECERFNICRIIEKCKKYEIYLNQIEIPFYGSMGLRIGLHEITSLEYSREDVICLAKLISAIIRDIPISAECNLWLVKKRKKQNRMNHADKIWLIRQVIKYL